MAEGTTINIYGSVTGENVMMGSHNQLNAAQFADAAPLPAFDKDAPIADVGSLPAGSHLPFLRNELFTGREAELKAVAESLLGRQTSAVIKQAVTGMGGMGKTQLAVEFGYRYGRFFRGVHWLNMANPESVNSEIANCGMQMGLPNFPDDLPSQVILTVNTWKAHGPRLLILDNFEEVGLVNQVMKHFNHSNLRVLLTSRHSDWSPAMGLNPIPLDVFSAEESLAFLKKSQERRKDTDEELSLLAHRLGHLPLALELASRYLSGHPRLNVVGYLEQASHALDHPSMQNWRKDLPDPTEHDLSLVNTFALSWQAVTDKTAQAVFVSAGYLAPNEPILLEIFEEVLGDLEKSRVSKSKLVQVTSSIKQLFSAQKIANTSKLDKPDIDAAVQNLLGLGLFKREENNLPSIHPLLTEYARKVGKDKKIIDVVADVFVTLSDKANNKGIPNEFIFIKSHIPVVARLAENAKTGYAGVLWNNYGYYLDMIADYSGACTAYERALRVDEGAFGPDHPNVAIRVNNLGCVLRTQGDLEGARVAFERALKIDKTTLGPDHPNVAIHVNNLGSVLQAQGDLEGARVAFECALKIDISTFGPDHPNVAIRVNNLGGVLKAQGDLEGARVVYERALKIFENQLGENHPNVAALVNNIGEVMRQAGNVEGARTAFERAMKIDEGAFGPDHPNVARDINNLGLVMKQLGDWESARVAFERALSIFKKFLPPDHPNIKTVQRNLDGLGLPSTNKNHE